MLMIKSYIFEEEETLLNAETEQDLDKFEELLKVNLESLMREPSAEVIDNILTFSRSLNK